MVFPPEVSPRDKWITKAQRCVTKRMLDVVNVWDVRTVMNQRTAGAGRKQLIPSTSRRSRTRMMPTRRRAGIPTLRRSGSICTPWSSQVVSPSRSSSCWYRDCSVEFVQVPLDVPELRDSRRS